MVRGWHSDIALPVQALDARLDSLRATFPGARYLVFGIGERSFLMKDRTNLLDMLGALLPSPTAMLVTALRVPPPEAFPAPSDVVPVHITPDGLTRLSGFIAASFAYAPSGGPRLLAVGPYPGSLFYYATPIYSGLYTCNTWSAEALRAAGLPISPVGLLFAGDVADGARRSGP
ncbi:MAG: DUF2459 domain-containing protein [Acetobacteraceae bacterium]